ncbi:hypothetical protein TR80_009520 [Xanthomonas campestris]|uniref:hypothetical protein n=1 Tax=Xanthomonas campestris TaxID=339 RepID=UPI000CDA3280|nr:hypothetical protein [Xanthomonas campestris]TXD43086.1 hypothetical protein TR80_009520 [Xanthomonas campestris]
MTQREVSHAVPLPACKAGHPGRHILDGRRLHAGGGHLIECRCARTKKHPDFDQALAEWKRMHRIRVPRPHVAHGSNVVQLGLRLKGGAEP